MGPLAGGSNPGTAVECHTLSAVADNAVLDSVERPVLAGLGSRLSALGRHPAVHLGADCLLSTGLAWRELTQRQPAAVPSRSVGAAPDVRPTELPQTPQNPDNLVKSMNGGRCQDSVCGCGG